MGRSKMPLEKAKLTGADKKNPQRYRDRSEPDGGGPLGEAPSYFSAVQRKIWKKFKDELPWLARADRALVEIACVTRAQIEAGDTTAGMLREHRQQLASLGATPVSRSNVTAPKDPDENDPFSQFGGMQ